MIRQDELYTVTELLSFMSEAGLPSSRMWLYTTERQGKLVCPRLTNSRKDRVFTEKQMEEIIEAFSPGGKGFWKYEKQIR